MAQQIKVSIIGDSSSLSRALSSAERAAGGFGSKLGSVAKAATVAAGAAGIGALIVTMKRGWDEFSEGAKVAAQTNAVLKSTGGVSNTTAKSIGDLAQAISEKSGIDDEAIQSGENMLLTFTNVRNEVGRGNDIFNQSTKILTNMSVVLGTDMNKSAIQLGKALNDPIKGVGALSRVGVTFTAGQKESIKAMVDAGNTMGAQKLILAELNKEFGGSAEAVGKTLPGQLNILKESFSNVAGGLLQSMIPALTSLLSWVSSNMPTIQAVLTAVFSGIQTAVQTTADFIRNNWGTITNVFNAVWAALQAAWPTVKAILDGLARAFQYVVEWVRANWPTISTTFINVFDTIKGVVQGAVTVITALWNRFGNDIINAVRTHWNTIKGVIEGVLNLIKGVVNVFAGVLHGDWSRAWQGVKQITSGLLGGIYAVIKGFAMQFLNAAKSLGAAIVDGMAAGLVRLAGAVAEQVARVWNWLTNTAVDLARSAASAVGRGIIGGLLDGIGDVFTTVVNWIWGGIQGAIDWVKNKLGIESPSKVMANEVGKPMAEGVGQGFAAGMLGMAASAGAAVDRLLTGIKNRIAAAKAAFASAFADFASAATSAFDAKLAAWQPPSQILLNKMQIQEQLAEVEKMLPDGLDKVFDAAVAALQRGDTKAAAQLEANLLKGVNAAIASATSALSTAQDALAAAQASGDPEAIAKAQADVDAAQKRLDDLVEARRKMLEALAVQEQAAHDKKAIADQIRFQNDLDALEKHLNSMKLTHKQKHDEIIAFLTKYGLKGGPYDLAAQGIGVAIALGLREKIKEVTAAADELAKAIMDKLNLSIVVSIKVEGAPGGAPGKAAGGDVLAQMPYIVGEKGPELFVPGVRGTILPNHSLGRIGSRTGVVGGSSVVLNFHGPVYGDKQKVADELASAVDEALRRRRSLGYG